MLQQSRAPLYGKKPIGAAKRCFRERLRAGGPAVRMMILLPGLLLAGCHGSTLDSLYPVSIGHRPPPAVNLPAADCRTPPAGATVRCLAPHPPA
jgi:hypothetical protein